MVVIVDFKDKVNLVYEDWAFRYKLPKHSEDRTFGVRKNLG